MEPDPTSSDKMRAARARSPSSSDIVPRPDGRPAAPALVLVVEDEESLGRALLRFLRGYEVVYCQSVGEALVRIRAGELFDVIVSDMMMPGGNGNDLYAVLLAEAPDLAPRTLFMTGGATTPETVAFVVEHAANVLPKPLDLASLRLRVDVLLADFGPISRDRPASR